MTQDPGPPGSRTQDPQDLGPDADRVMGLESSASPDATYLEQNGDQTKHHRWPIVFLLSDTMDTQTMSTYMKTCILEYSNLERLATGIPRIFRFYFAEIDMCKLIREDIPCTA